ncbi:hypothetical protein [Flavobacterium urocaniciphilum]|uniref:Lipoprotein n=1 Tax=Flavobacterium urocaniciphilum TaxID=1299341 RepID=A0A1H9BX96_9FLAO|nr:hypothetical protein [Flavobacterium urocaniciphilum]SEP92998.1 hypothetical protein SAMN05444005_103247 [Flavobacterium urocaniciphilum]
MKLFTLLATLVITITGCNCQKKKLENANFAPPEVVETRVSNMQTEVPTMYYEANTRGFFMALKVENKTLYISRDRDFKEYSDKKTISDKDWTEISALAKAVDLEKVKDLKWPTEKRYYDGAAHANIIFESKGVKYPANGFDHGFPPVEIETLVNKITKLAEQE